LDFVHFIITYIKMLEETPSVVHAVLDERARRRIRDPDRAEMERRDEEAKDMEDPNLPYGGIGHDGIWEEFGAFHQKDPTRLTLGSNRIRKSAMEIDLNKKVKELLAPYELMTKYLSSTPSEASLEKEKIRVATAQANAGLKNVEIPEVGELLRHFLRYPTMSKLSKRMTGIINFKDRAQVSRILSQEFIKSIKTRFLETQKTPYYVKKKSLQPKAISGLYIKSNIINKASSNPEVYNMYEIAILYFATFAASLDIKVISTVIPVHPENRSQWASYVILLIENSNVLRKNEMENDESMDEQDSQEISKSEIKIRNDQIKVFKHSDGGSMRLQYLFWLVDAVMKALVAFSSQLLQVAARRTEGINTTDRSLSMKDIIVGARVLAALDDGHLSLVSKHIVSNYDESKSHAPIPREAH
jgi:hypothetical protein